MKKGAWGKKRLGTTALIDWVTAKAPGL